MDKESEQELLEAMQAALESELPDRYEDLVKIFRYLQPSGEGVFFGLVEMICRQEDHDVSTLGSDQVLTDSPPFYPLVVRQKALLVLIRILREKLARLAEILVADDGADLLAAKRELAGILSEVVQRLKVRSIDHAI